MARAKQVAACLICDNFPCTCPGSKPERKPRAKKSVAPKVSTSEPVPPDSGGHVAPDRSIPQREELDQALPRPRRKRARFAVAAQPEIGADNTAQPNQPRQELRFDAEAVAIRNLAHGGLLGPSSRAEFAEVIGTPDPDTTRRVAEWRRNRAT